MIQTTKKQMDYHKAYPVDARMMYDERGDGSQYNPRCSVRAFSTLPDGTHTYTITLLRIVNGLYVPEKPDLQDVPHDKLFQLRVENND